MYTVNQFRLQEQYGRLRQNIKLGVLHPNAYGSHRVLGQILLEQHIAVYAHLPTHAENEYEALLPVLEALQSQVGFATPALPSRTNQYVDWIVNVLNSSNEIHLLIEGYDGSVARLLNEAVFQIVSQLKSGSRIILSGRVLAFDLINALIPDGKVAILPVDEKHMLIDYTNPSAQHILEVRAFGSGQVLVDGRPIEKWEGILPRAMFYFFVDRALTTRDDIFKTFWPKLNVREATNVFHVTKRKISEILNIHPVVYGGGFYRISPDIQLHYDVVNFQEAVQNAAIADDKHAEELYQLAIDLYHDDFLTGLEGDWITRRRDEMRVTYTDALVGLGRIREHYGDSESALGLFLRASNVAPQREDLVRSIMKLYDELGRAKLAMDLYKRFEKQLSKNLGVTPDRLTVELAENIRAHV